MVNERSIANFANFALATIATVLAGLFIANDPFILIVTFFLSYPWKIGENVYSLFGGVNYEGSVYSLCSVFQIAKDDAYSFFAVSLFQKAGYDAEVLFGFLLSQNARHDASIFIGLSLIQKAGWYAEVFFGFFIIQKLGNKTRIWSEIE